MYVQQLLAAAEARATSTETNNVNVQAQERPAEEDRRITRSQGITLAWNPVMNNAQVLVGKDSDTE
jgi:hypothetical protein